MTDQINRINRSLKQLLENFDNDNQKMENVLNDLKAQVQRAEGSGSIKAKGWNLWDKIKGLTGKSYKTRNKAKTELQKIAKNMKEESDDFKNMISNLLSLAERMDQTVTSSNVFLASYHDHTL